MHRAQYWTPGQCEGCGLAYEPERNSPLCLICRPMSQKNRSLKHNFKITLFQWREMLREQDGKCLACGSDGPEFHVDHDHSCCPTWGERSLKYVEGLRWSKRTCGKCIRGLICEACNISLGLLKEDPQRLRRLAIYAEKCFSRGDAVSEVEEEASRNGLI